MSQAKRDQSAFHQSAVVGRAFARANPAGTERWAAPIPVDLRVLDSWENRASPGGDPYNGIGARAVAGPAQRK